MSKIVRHFFVFKDPTKPVNLFGFLKTKSGNISGFWGSLFSCP